MLAMSSHTRVSTDDRLVVKVFHESISVRKLPKTKTKLASIPDDTIVLHRILTSVGRREGEVKVGGRGGGTWREKGEEGERRTGGGTSGSSRERMGEVKGEGERIRWVSN